MDKKGQQMRTSDRIFVEIPITIVGTNMAGQHFVESTNAIVLSRRGARIIASQALAPDQRLTIQCVKTGKEAVARVVGPIMGEGSACHYGIAFLQPDINIWGVHFPVLDGTENPASRMFLECAECHAQEVVHLDVFELEVFLANRFLTRACPKCAKRTAWMRSASREGPSPANPAIPDPTIATQERKSPRIKLEVPVCLRNPQFGEEVVTTENVSRGGFRVRSQKDYPLGTVLEAALPYSPGAANIFTPARIVHKQVGIGANTFAYGIAYVPAPLAPSLTGLRITQPK